MLLKLQRARARSCCVKAGPPVHFGMRYYNDVGKIDLPRTINMTYYITCHAFRITSTGYALSLEPLPHT